MDNVSKGKSPFYPTQPVPVELFVGRSAEIDRIMIRGAAQVELGKPIAIYTQGEYGIGKSSVAGYVQLLAEKRHALHPIYASMGGCKTLEDVAAQILEATIRSGALNPKRDEKIKDWLAKYIGDQSLFSINLNLNLLKKDAPTLTSAYAMLSFLEEAHKRLADTGIRGLFLVLDEINGIVTAPEFAGFVKGLVDSNALSKKPVPVLLMLCGVEEKRREMIRHHEPIDRIFDIVEIGPLSVTEMEEFFRRSFDEVKVGVEKRAMEALTYYSAGFPKIMHLVGDAAYWLDKDGVIDEDDAMAAVFNAAEDVGRKFVDQQVYRALQSKSYHSILEKMLASAPVRMVFRKSEVESRLTPGEKTKFHNFIKRMRDLKVLRAGDERGEYVFNSRMVRLYMRLRAGRVAHK